jgi:hypothetical protein
MAETFKARSGYYSRKEPELKTYRAMTLDEVKALRYGDHVDCLDLNGNVRTVKINGKVRRWKRDPDRVEVPCKYGLYEYITFTNADINRLVIEVGV